MSFYLVSVNDLYRFPLVKVKRCFAVISEDELSWTWHIEPVQPPGCCLSQTFTERFHLFPVDLQCSVSCGLGIQRREPMCRQWTATGDQVKVARELCSGLPSPPLVRTCRMMGCPSKEPLKHHMFTYTTHSLSACIPHYWGVSHSRGPTKSSLFQLFKRNK